MFDQSTFYITPILIFPHRGGRRKLKASPSHSTGEGRDGGGANHYIKHQNFMLGSCLISQVSSLKSHVSCLLCALLTFILIATDSWADLDLLPDAVLLPSVSAAVSDDAMATAVNPAGLGVKRGKNVYYFHTFSAKTGGDNAFFVSSSGMGFGAEFSNPGPVAFTKYTLSDGMKVFDGLYFGSSYAWFNSKDELWKSSIKFAQAFPKLDDAYDKLSSWNVGLLYRPFRLLSIGMVAYNLNRPVFGNRVTDRVYNLSLAFRPYTNRVTLSVDSEFQESQKIRDAKFTCAMECEPIDGVTIRGSYSNRDSFDIRVGIGLGQFEIGAYSRFDNDWNRGGGAAYARFSDEQYRTKFQPGHYVLEMEAEDLASQDSPLQRAKEDKAIDGVILKLDLGQYSMATLQEMRDAVLDFRSSGKRAICYLELAGNKEYCLATACDKILLNPAGYLSLNGLRSEVTFYKGALDRLGIEADLYSMGKYKSASEMLTREDMSDAHRESLNSLLDDLNEQMVSQIADGRGMSIAVVRKKIDEGPYTAREAINAGLVDVLVYADQLEEAKKQIFGERAVKLPGKRYVNYKYHAYDWDTKPKLAVIYAGGIIAPGKSIGQFSLLVPQIMGSKTIGDAIKSAREDKSIKAIVLRIDSGGGSVFASDLIWRELMLTKGKKPLIVSMGDAAASGGYYIACPADVVVAQPGTITGSIGVISGKFSLRGLYDRLGIKKEILKRGENSDIYTLYNVFTEEQQEIVKRQTQEIYDDFIAKVAQGRKMSKEAVEAIAQGRVWTGKQAKDNGLVDELGGMQLALSIAKSKAGLKPDQDVDIVAFPERVPFWKSFIFGETDFSFGLGYLREVIEAAERLANDRIFFIMPYSMDYE